ncbi:MAG: DNA primase [Clostridia bacterium]|nr:DNA primase [Clostridia bacterium]
MLPESFLQELLAKNDIESVVSSYVAMKRRGRNLVGLCPFHGEKTPSFNLYPETSSFYCFGCGAGGDVITFIKKIENLSYIDAVKFLADRVGMTMPEHTFDDTAAKQRVRILEANREAARLYHACLYSAEGRAGLEYYYSRGYTDTTIRRFGLGYAPPGFGFLRDELRKKGFHEEELVLAWLCARGRNNPRSVYDIFRNRVMIPIIDVRGNVIAFGGRVLDDSKPKYLNSAETPVFKKTNNLFALNFAKQGTHKQLILCEGYMDVIALHQAGFTNAVAALGTSFTADHARLMSRYTDEAVLIFDADAAGQKGAQRAISLLRDTGINVRLVSIPDGKDPDEFIRKNGAERFKLLVERSANDVEYRLMELGKRHLLSTSEGKVAYLKEAALLLSELTNPLERDVYITRLANDLSVSKDALQSQVSYQMKRRQKQQQERQMSTIVRQSETTLKKVNPDAAGAVRAASAEEALLGMLILNPDYLAEISKQLSPDDMVTALNRRIYEFLLERFRQGKTIEMAFLSEQFNTEEMAYISKMVRESRERVSSLVPEEAKRYACIIKRENQLHALRDPSGLTPEQIQEKLKTMKEMKQ